MQRGSICFFIQSHLEPFGIHPSNSIQINPIFVPRLPYTYRPWELRAHVQHSVSTN